MSDKDEATRPVCKLTECQGKPRCRMCLAMDARYAAPPDQSERIAALEAERDDFHMKYRAKCDEETKAQAMRIAAQVAALQAGLQKQSAALSRISYACEPPNEYECSSYDVHCDESAVVEQVKARLAELQAERDALLADAERYRWLRDNFGNNFFLDHLTSINDFDPLSGDEVDAAIDAARSAP